jgi:hypothetical protein
MIPYRKFSDALKDGSYAIPLPNPPKAPKVDVASHIKVDTLGSLGALGGQRTEIQGDLEVPTAGTNLFAPLFKPERPAEGEPGLEVPCAARRGRVEERPDRTFLHFCHECGRWGSYGFGVALRSGQLGRWYCAAHRPGSLKAT